MPDAFNETDIRHLKAVADAFPSSRFEIFILWAKLSPFTPQKIELARTINDRWRARVILLTERELEAERTCERTEKALGLQLCHSTAEDLAFSTATIYFPDPPFTHSNGERPSPGPEQNDPGAPK